MVFTKAVLSVEDSMYMSVILHNVQLSLIFVPFVSLFFFFFSCSAPEDGTNGF